MKSSPTANAPLPLLWLTLFVIGGALMVRVSYLLADSAEMAGAAGAALLLALVGLQRRQAVTQPGRVLTSWEQVPPRALVTAVIVAMVALSSATILQADMDSGWAAVAIFVGAALIADWLVRAGSESRPVDADQRRQS